MSESAKEAFRAMMEQVWNQKSPDAIDECISEGYIGRNPDGDITGLDGFRQLLRHAESHAADRSGVTW